MYLCPEEAGGEHSDSHGTGCSSSEEESRSSFSTSEDSRSNDDFKCKLTLGYPKPFCYGWQNVMFIFIYIYIYSNDIDKQQGS